MPIIASEGTASTIPTHPEGQFASSCIDVIDMGMVEMNWQGQTRTKHRIVIRFFCGEDFVDAEGQIQPLWVDKWFTLSLHENSALRPFLENWRGKKFTPDELKGFDVEKLVGVSAYLQISHNATPTKTYANIDTLIRLPKGMEAPAAPTGYVRVKDRAPKNGSAPAEGQRYDDDNLPF